jgi:hypothetical protein
MKSKTTRNVDHARILLSHLSIADIRAVSVIAPLAGVILAKPPKIPRIVPCQFRFPGKRPYTGMVTPRHRQLILKAATKSYQDVVDTLGQLLGKVSEPVGTCIDDLLNALAGGSYCPSLLGACYFDTAPCQNLSQSQCTPLNPYQQWVGGQCCPGRGKAKK